MIGRSAESPNQSFSQMGLISITLIFRGVAWPLAFAVATFTLSPIEPRPVAAAPAGMEHLEAFVVIRALLYFDYPNRRLRTILLVAVVAGLLESLQHVVPGRHGQVHDFGIKPPAS